MHLNDLIKVNCHPSGHYRYAYLSSISICQPMLLGGHLIALDFGYEFVTVHYSTSIVKLNLPDKACNWLRYFFDGHSHCTQFAGD